MKTPSKLFYFLFAFSLFASCEQDRYFVEEDFENARVSKDADSILKAIMKNHFREFEFVNHYSLMINKVVGAIPYGINPMSNSDIEFSIFQFLFHYEQPGFINP